MCMRHTQQMVQLKEHCALHSKMLSRCDMRIVNKKLTGGCQPAGLVQCAEPPDVSHEHIS